MTRASHQGLRCLVAIAVAAAAAFSAMTQRSAPAQTAIVEFEKAPGHVEPPDRLGTGPYKTREKEAPFYKRLPNEERVTGGLLKKYDITDHEDEFISWFGIVRGIRKTPAGYELLLDHKYFDGMTDFHLQVVSMFGSGDFRARLKLADPKPLAKLEHLDLIRVYGKVVDTEDDVPIVAAEYARVFPWMTFAFMGYGEDHRNEKWRKLTRLRGHRLYSHTPDEIYYEKCLGPRKDREEIEKPARKDG